jgi:hypothetical protein
MASRAYQVSQHFFPRSAQPFLVMTDGAFVALVFVVSNLVDWLVSLISPLAYLPPTFTQNSGWRPGLLSLITYQLQCELKQKS